MRKNKKWNLNKKLFYQLDGVVRNWLGVIQMLKNGEMDIKDSSRSIVFLLSNNEYNIFDKHLENVILVCANGAVIDEL